MFYNQPLATRFGTDLLTHLRSGAWNKLDIAVAWVRASGMAHLAAELASFLASGNQLSVIVGVDLDNTSKEGLEALLELERHGAASTHVHHNETGTIFHPKLYLFRNDTRAKLIVGSNNITEAGLFRNTEAGLEVDVAISDPLVPSVLNALAAWRDPAMGLALRLDAVLLSDLVVNGYVKDEAAVRAEAAKRGSHTSGSSRRKLFGSVSVTPPVRPSGAVARPLARGGARAPRRGVAPASTVAATTSAGQVLLMRVRTARGTQAQMPLAVVRQPFFSGARQVTSVADGTTRGINPTHAVRSTSKNPNTLKLELPETASMSDPVVRFERTPVGIQYEVYDSSSPQGKLIMSALKLGLRASPPSTHLTLPSAPDRATWWRFI